MKANRDGSGHLRIDVGALGICFVTTAALYFAALRPLMVQQADAADAAIVLANEERNVDAFDGQCRRIAQRLDQFDTNRSDTTLKLEDRAQLNTRLGGLMRLAQQCGLSIEGVHPGTRTHGRFFDVVDIQLVAEGKYRDAVNFLQKLHGTHEDISVNAFDLEVVGSNEIHLASATFDLAWYVLKRRE